MHQLPKWQARMITGFALGGIVFIIGILYAGIEELIAAFSIFFWPYFILGLALAFLNYYLRYLKFDYYLKLLDIHISRKEGFSIFLSGMVLTITPGKLGEVLKSFLIKNVTGVSVARTAPIIVAERLTDFIAMMVLSLGGILFLENGVKALGASISLILIFFLIIGNPRIAHGIINFIGRTLKLKGLGEKLLESYDSTRTLIGIKPLAVATALSLPAWFFECLAFYLIIRGFNAEVSLMYATFVYAASTIFGVLSPGGLGFTEGGLAGLLIKAGVTENIAVAATFIVRVCTLWFAVFVGAVALLLRHQKLTDFGEVLEADIEGEKAIKDQS